MIIRSIPNLVAGALLWLGALTAHLLGVKRVGDLTLLLLLAVLVITPLALRAVAQLGDEGRSPMLQRLAALGQLPAAVVTTVSFFLAPGAVAAALALPWFLFTLLLAAQGFWRFWRPGHRRPALEDVVVDLGLIYAAAGGGWLLVSRAGLQPMGFPETIVTLTAVHFHYIPLAAMVMTGLLGRALRERPSAAWTLYRPAAAGMIMGPPLVALGITFWPLLETIAALVLALSLGIVALLTLTAIVPRSGVSSAGLLLAVSSVAAILAMFFATAYAVDTLSGARRLSIATMIQVHGWVNALGFSLCGLAGWLYLAPADLLTGEA